MGEILGIGTTHYPGLVVADEFMPASFRRIMNAPNVDPRYRDRANWQAEGLAELGDDDGLATARQYRARMWENFRRLRAEVDAFNPDFIVIFGDDQYENFKEDIIPTFCVFGLDDDFEVRPWSHGQWSKIPNAWGEPKDWTLRIHGHRNGARALTAGLIRRGIPMPYAYKLHSDLAHAFVNTVLYLDCDRRGFDHPIVPFHVNCYGSAVLSAGGAFDHLFNAPRQEAVPDPPGPSPAMCMEVGAKLAQAAAESPYRIVLMASSSWSHAFLSSAMGWVIPDHNSDRLMLDALRRCDYDFWRQRTQPEAEAAGQQEMLNWWVLVGAMAELGRKPIIHDYIESQIFMSDKCFVSFPAK